MRCEVLGGQVMRVRVGWGGGPCERNGQECERNFSALTSRRTVQV